LLIGLIILVLLLFGLLSIPMMGYAGTSPWGGWMGPGMMGGYGFGWGILMLLFWALIIGGIVLLVVRLSERNQLPEGPSRPYSGDRALDILRERYARGEITKEQFDQMRRDLGETGTSNSQPQG
ncbi:MAG TPA: SHOCT domain-containing protein, partial [Chloroflexota bacterium]|nr:SHOCT domain-containing protein [Chloroflexota bacterium]